MRFFESLAAEASLDKQMEGVRAAAPAPAPPVPVGAPERVAAAPAPPSDVIRQMFAPDAKPSATVPAAAEPASAPVSVRSDAFGGDEILELPSLEPIIPPGPPHLNNVLEIEFPSDHVTQPMSSQPALSESGTSTAAFASERPASPFQPPPPPPPAEPETPRTTLGLASPFTAASELAPGETEESTAPTTPRLAPPPRPIVLPSRTPSIAPLAASGSETAPVEPFAPASPVGGETAPIEPFAPAQASPSAYAESAGSAAAFANRQSPGEMAQAYVTSWVSPEVEEPKRSRRRIGPLTLLALLVAIAILVVVWKFGLDGRFPGSSAQKAPQPHQAGPAQPAPSPATTPSETGPTPSAAAAAQPPATAAATANAPSGSGGYTIQLRSSPNEADSAAYVTALKGAGFDAYVMRADLGARGTWYRVRVGRFDSRTEAQQALGKLRSSGHGGDAIVQQYEAP